MQKKISVVQNSTLGLPPTRPSLTTPEVVEEGPPLLEALERLVLGHPGTCEAGGDAPGKLLGKLGKPTIKQENHGMPYTLW